MRDLEADLAVCANASSPEFMTAAPVGWPEAIKRALTAEERVDKLEDELRMLQDTINQSNNA